MSGNPRLAWSSWLRPAGFSAVRRHASRHAPGDRRDARPAVERLESRALMALTGVAGEDQPFDNAQPSLALHYIINVQGSFPRRREGEGATTQPMTGEIDLIAGDVVPRGWAPCDGQFALISNAFLLFAVVGTTYGGDGVKTFALPNLQDRAVVGAGEGKGLPARPFARPFGRDLVRLSERQMPLHVHSLPDGGVTAPAGGELPFDNAQPSMALHYLISPVGSPGSAQVRLFAGDYAPDGYLTCNGQVLQIARHEHLFDLLGAAYGGDGKTTFALPDLRGRLGVGTGATPGAKPLASGEQTGRETIRLTQAQMPAHSHALPGGGVTSTAGEGRPVDDMQPSLAMNYMIATVGAFPSGDTIDRDAGGDLPFLGQIRAFAGDAAPPGWTPADGRLLPISTNPALFALLGVTYGGDGVTTFALPDLRGRVPVGTGTGQAGRAPGAAFGDATIRLTVAQLPSHAHRFNESTANDGAGAAGNAPQWRGQMR